jgi:hypothetical protein
VIDRQCAAAKELRRAATWSYRRRGPIVARIEARRPFAASVGSPGSRWPTPRKAIERLKALPALHS